MSAATQADPYLIVYGPDANCSFAIGCTLQDTIYKYEPSYAASGVYIALFGIALFAHLYRGIRWREWTYMGCIIAGCIVEMVGYGGRIMLHQNPWTFSGFLMQIICITTAPVFFCAAIYLLLTRITTTLGPQYSYIRPSFYYLIFLPCDIVSLVLQALGGALSSTSSGSNQNGVSIALAGLSFQVVTLFAFGVACITFGIRYHKDKANPNRPVKPPGFRIWAGFLSLAIVCIFIRCAYRIHELQEGYSGKAITDEGMFIALEGAMIVVAAYALLVSVPGPIFQRGSLFKSGSLSEKGSHSPPAMGHESDDYNTKSNAGTPRQ